MIKLGIVMDPIATINIKKDTSFAMLLEAQRRGYELHYMEMNDLYLINGEARARTRTLSVEQNYDKWYDFTGEQDLPLADLHPGHRKAPRPVFHHQPGHHHLAGSGPHIQTHADQIRHGP